MKKLLRMEAYELRHDYICLLMIGITFVYGVFSGSGYIDCNYFKLPQGGYEVFIGMLYDSVGNIILISIFAALLIGKSFSNRTILSKITSGNSRRNVFFSKAISILIISIMSIIIYPIAGGLIVTLKYGWNVPIWKSVINLIKIIICTLLLDSVIFSVTIFMATIFRDTVRTVTASTIIIFFNAVYLYPAKVMNLPISMHPMHLLRTVLENNSLPQFISLSLYAIVVLSVILILSYNVFRKCELK